jgi:alpha-tubulin suppressor-like RCC1 family protein
MFGRSRNSTAALVAVLATAALVGACDQSTGPTSVTDDTFAANVRVLTGDAQTGAVALPLSERLRVRVVDAGGQPVRGAQVTWQIRAGGGTLNPPAGVSDVNGEVVTTWTLGTTLGANRAVALLQGAYLLDSVVFNATARAGAPTRIEIDTLVATPRTARVADTLGAPIRYIVRDNFGHVVPGAQVTFTVSPVGATVFPTTAVTDENGKVGTNLILGTTVGQYNVIASVGAVTSPAFTATATPDTTRVITVQSGGGQIAAAGASVTNPVTVRLADAFGNPIAGEQIVFNDSLTGGLVVTPLAANTNTGGLATATVRLATRAGSQTVRVRSGTGAAAVRATASFTGQVAFRDVFVGSFQTCALSTDDRAWCWGNNLNGQLGKINLLNTAGPTVPVPVTADTINGPFHQFRFINGGKSHTCGVTVARLLFCWGASPDWRAGYVLSTQGQAQQWFTDGSLGLSYETVSASDQHTCALRQDGLVECRGYNGNGALGVGTVVTPTSQVTTVPVTSLVPPPPLFAQVVSGLNHNCALADLSAGPLYGVPFCWGLNSRGQLGRDTATVLGSAFATQIDTSLIVPFTRYDDKSLVAGANHTCGLIAGAAFCWGADNFGQLGRGGATAPGPNTRFHNPQPVAGGLVFKKLFAGDYHTCGITTADQAFCWGLNSSGQLGIGSVANANAPTAVDVPTGTTWRSLALGEEHACGIANATGSGGSTIAGAGILFCWGDNEFGQLGLGTAGANAAAVVRPTRVAFQP